MHVHTNTVWPTIVIHTNAVFTHHCRTYTCSVTHHCHTYKCSITCHCHAYTCSVTHHCHTCTVTHHCHTYKCSVTHHCYTYKCSVTHHRYTYKCNVKHHCHTYKCSVTHHCHTYKCRVTHCCHAFTSSVTHHCYINAVLRTTPAAALQLWGCWWAADSVALCCVPFSRRRTTASRKVPPRMPQTTPSLSTRLASPNTDLHCQRSVVWMYTVYVWKIGDFFFNQYFVIGIVDIGHCCCGEYPVVKASHVSCSTFSGTHNMLVAYFWCSVAVNMIILFGVQFLTSKQHQSCSEYDYYACDTVCGWF